MLCFHTFGNMTGGVMGFASEMYPFVLVDYAVSTLIVVLVLGPYSFRGLETPLPRSREQGEDSIASQHR